MGLENEMLEFIKFNNPRQPEEKIKSPNAQSILCAAWYQHCQVQGFNRLEGPIITKMFSHHVVCLKINTSDVKAIPNEIQS